MKFRFACLLTLVCSAAAAQSDTTRLLRPEHLGEEDIQFRDPGQQKPQAISATRSPEDVDRLPFTVWVVTADEILRYGFVTLGDVLRAAPGIRVSQPGNALEGETFLMRGLTGNEYVKILINDVPIKPSIAPGMPIGAQLPIRQAERIEVFYGPAASIYGNEACAGVVNIILKETERPVYTQADLSFGGYGYNSLDLMFGGKLGKDKSIFRFSLYGSSTVRDNTDLFYDTDLYNANNYLPYGLDSSVYLLNPNFRPAEPGGSAAKLAPVPHESRMFGINLTWRGMHFTYHRMGRFDHSALGLNPLAAGWYNPSNRLAERLETFSLGFQRKRKNRTTYNTFSTVRYHVNSTSTTTHVFDRLSAATYSILSPLLTTEQERQILRQEIYRHLASDERYASAAGLDLRFESRMTAALRPRFFLELGAQVMGGGGTPVNTYYSVPVETRLDVTYDPINVKPFAPIGFNTLDLTGYAQFEWRGKRLYLTGGGALNWMIDYGFVPAPRLAAQYRIDSTWSVRGNFSSGYRRPPLYASVNSYVISYAYQDGVSRYTGSENFADAEKTYAAELAARYRRPVFSAEGVFFYQSAHHLLREGYLTEEPGFVPTWRYGFANAPGLAMTIWGVQGLFTRERTAEWNLSGKKDGGFPVTWRLELFAQYARGREWFGYGLLASPEVRNQPSWMLQMRTSWRTERFELMLASNRQQAAASKAVTWRDAAQRPDARAQNPAFRTWDAMIRFNLSDHFLIYLQGQNLFNKRYAGLDATGTPDDLAYNPQPGRLVRLGVNYNMNVKIKRREKAEITPTNTLSEDDNHF